MLCVSWYHSLQGVQNEQLALFFPIDLYMVYDAWLYVKSKEDKINTSLARLGDQLNQLSQNTT